MPKGPPKSPEPESSVAVAKAKVPSSGVEGVQTATQAGGVSALVRHESAGAAEAGTTFKAETIFEVSLGLNCIEMDDDIVVFDVLGNKYFRLNATGAFIWRLVLERSSFSQIANQLSRTYQLTTEKAEETASAFLEKLVSQGLVVQSTS